MEDNQIQKKNRIQRIKRNKLILGGCITCLLIALVIVGIIVYKIGSEKVNINKEQVNINIGQANDETIVMEQANEKQTNEGRTYVEQANEKQTGCGQTSNEQTSGGQLNGVLDKDLSILKTHMQDFSDEPCVEIQKALNNSEAKKVYLLLNNSWFNSEDLIDFSQVVTKDYKVYAPTNSFSSYDVYSEKKDGDIEWLGNCKPSSHNEIGFFNLTYAMIDKMLGNEKKSKYIITYSNSLNIIFIWVQNKNSEFIIPLSLNNYVGLENGKRYQLGEISKILKNTIG